MRVCFIWHMHQPYYKDLESGEYLMPWVRLHGVKDYLDMPQIADPFPRIKQCFNLVPSLLEQIQDYVSNHAQDRHLVLSRRKPQELSEQDRSEIVKDFFSAHYPTMIEPYPRYGELYDKCGRGQTKAKNLTDREILDLQVWSNATWIDPSLRLDPRVKSVFEKGRDFTESDKHRLLDYQIEILSKIVPAYAARQKQGSIEVSFSPWYHPILPLLVDSESAKVAMPSIRLPSRRFSHPEDAEYHVRSAAELYRRLFGEEQFGMWPSEGSVSEAILPILRRNGITWLASDEQVFYASLHHPEARKRGMAVSATAGFHRPYLVGSSDAPLGILFRDHRLSDKIGFVYSGWDPEKAVTDFLDELHRLAALYGGTESEHVVSIILDGENAWEYYRNDGHDFLRLLYEELEHDQSVETALPSEIFAETERIERLPYLFSGSWINHNFRVWIGHDEDNRAWDLLTTTRDRLVEFLQNHPDFDPQRRELAWKAIYIAEGSDWCWWYGDEHQTAHFDLFDRLFRKHLQTVWELIGVPPPMELMEPIRRTTSQQLFTAPSDLLKPVIDGRHTSFFEWYGAGNLPCFKLGSAMHRATRLLHQFFFGYNHEELFFRFDPEEQQREETIEIQIEIFTGLRYMIRLNRSGARFFQWVQEQYTPVELPLRSAWDRISELAVPRSAIAFVKERSVHIAVSVYQNEKEVEKWPEASYISFELPEPGKSLFWQV